MGPEHRIRRGNRDNSEFPNDSIHCDSSRTCMGDFSWHQSVIQDEKTNKSQVSKQCALLEMHWSKKEEKRQSSFSKWYEE